MFDFVDVSVWARIIDRRPVASWRFDGPGAAADADRFAAWIRGADRGRWFVVTVSPGFVQR